MASSSLPSVNVIDHDTQCTSVQSQSSKLSENTETESSKRSSLTVPSTIKSSIGVNNPAQGSLFPLPDSQQIAGSKKGKVALGKGFSLMDWIRLTKSGKDLSGVGGPRVNGKIREVTRKELRQHRKRKDAWMALNGAVYNVTSYMDYHPGGWDELVKGAGKDATDMFNEIHKWVNYQGLLEACLVGKLVDDPAPVSPLSSRDKQLFVPPTPVLPPIPTKPPTPSVDFFQTESKITINIYSKRKGITKESIIIDNDEERVKIHVMLPGKEAFIYHMRLHKAVKKQIVFRVGSSSGKIEVDLLKYTQERWQSLGSPLENHLWFGPLKDLQISYRKWKVLCSDKVTHDTIYLVLDPPPGTIFQVPIGHHVQFKEKVEEIELTRSYTPVRLLSSSQCVQDDSLHFLIKIYPDGVFTPQLEKLSVGDSVTVSDHTGSFNVSQINGANNIYFLAAGTGSTPIFRLLHHLIQSKNGKNTKLLYFNKTQADIIWKEELIEIETEHPWFSVVHILSNEKEEWKGLRGRVTKELLGQYLSSTDQNSFVAICGPNPFTDECNRLLTEELEFGRDNIHLFKG